MSKSNIKIMNKAQEVSDEEIREMMNFADLMEKQKVAVAQKAKWNRTIRATLITASVLLILIAAYLYWPVNTSDSESSQPKLGNTTLDSTETERNNTPATGKENTILPKAEKENAGISSPKKEIKEKKLSIVVQSKPDSLSTTVSTPTPVQYTEAEPIEGFPHLYDFFNRELTYPLSALKDSIQGIETVSFIINKQGNTENIQIVNSLGKAFDQEALRIIGAMPAWKPATVNSKPIASKISLPLTFNFHTSKKK